MKKPLICSSLCSSDAGPGALQCPQETIGPFVVARCSTVGVGLRGHPVLGSDTPRAGFEGFGFTNTLYLPEEERIVFHGSEEVGMVGRQVCFANRQG